MDEIAVAVVEVGAPRGLDDEAAPVRAAAGAEGGGHVGEVAGGVHGVIPRGEPVPVGVAHVPEGLQRHGGGVSVAAIAHTLDMRTVDHIPAEGEAREGVLHHVVDSVEPRVGALEGGAPHGVDGRDLFYLKIEN